MNSTPAPNLVIIIAVLVQSVYIFLYSFRRRKLKSVGLFTLAEGFLLVGLIFLFIDYISLDIKTKETFYYIYRFFVHITVPVFLLFILDFVGKEKWLQSVKIYSIFFIPAIVNFVIVFFPHLYARITIGGNASYKTVGLWYWIGLIYIFLILLIMCFLTLQKAAKSLKIYKKQSIALFIGAFIPIAAVLINVSERFITFPAWLINNLPLLYFAGVNTSVFYAVFKESIFELKPIAHDLIINNLKAGLLTIDSREIIIDANPEVQKFTGLPHDYLVGRNINDIDVISGILKENAADLSEDKSIEFAIKNAGEYSILEMSIIKIFHHNELIGKNIIISDVTSRKKEEEVQRQLIESKNKIYSIIAHDLRNPLTSLTGYINILLSQDRLLSEDEKTGILKRLNLSANKISGLLENLLEWVMVQNGTLKAEKSCFSLYEIIPEIIQLFSSALKEKELSLDTEIDEFFEVYADKFMISTIIRNLISNAIKFTPPGGAIHLRAENSNSFSRICIIDNGIGISEDELTYIIADNNNIENELIPAKRNNYKRTGLGLTLCKEFAAANGGYINIKSELNKGSEFILMLPEKQTSG